MEQALLDAKWVIQKVHSRYWLVLKFNIWIGSSNSYTFFFALDSTTSQAVLQRPNDKSTRVVIYMNIWQISIR